MLCIDCGERPTEPGSDLCDVCRRERERTTRDIAKRGVPTPVKNPKMPTARRYRHESASTRQRRKK